MTWNELTGRQLLDVAKVLGIGYGREASRLDALLAALLLAVPCDAQARQQLSFGLSHLHLFLHDYHYLHE